MTGRGLSSSHIVSEHEYDALAAVGFDCGFMENEDSMPLLLGQYQKLMVTCSCGSEKRRSILAWKKQVTVGMAKLRDVEVAPGESVVSESQGNGLAEHAILEVTAQVRTLKKQVGECTWLRSVLTT